MIVKQCTAVRTVIQSIGNELTALTADPFYIIWLETVLEVEDSAAVRAEERSGIIVVHSRSIKNIFVTAGGAHDRTLTGFVQTISIQGSAADFADSLIGESIHKSPIPTKNKSKRNDYTLIIP